MVVAPLAVVVVAIVVGGNSGSSNNITKYVAPDMIAIGWVGEVGVYKKVVYKKVVLKKSSIKNRLGNFVYKKSF